MGSQIVLWGCCETTDDATDWQEGWSVTRLSHFAHCFHRSVALCSAYFFHFLPFCLSHFVTFWSSKRLLKAFLNSAFFRCSKYFRVLSLGSFGNAMDVLFRTGTSGFGSARLDGPHQRLKLLALHLGEDLFHVGPDMFPHIKKPTHFAYFWILSSWPLGSSED